MPITDRSQAKEGGFAQVRAALSKFKGKVKSAEWGKWGGQLVNPETGKPLPAKEFLEITSVENEVLEVTEELTMDISEEFNFRVNCSDFKGSFWIDMFLASADKHKVMIPDGLVDKVVTWEKQTLENENPKYNATNYVIAGIEVGSKAAPKKGAVKPAASVVPTGDPMDIVLNLALGKTSDELKAIIPTALAGSPLLPLANAGTVTQILLTQGKLALVDGKYQKPA